MADPVPDGFFILRNLKHPSDVLHRPDGILLTWYTEDDAEEFLAARIDDGKEWAVSKLTAHDYRRFNATRSHVVFGKWHEYKGNIVAGKETTKTAVIESSLVCLYEKLGDNRSYAISTKAENEQEFVAELASKIALLMPQRELWNQRLREWLPLAVDIVCKYRGYKAESVRERRELLAGDLVPDHQDEIKS